jgi:hypothetical protein
MFISKNIRHSGQPSIQLSPRGGKGNCLLSLWERIEVRVGRNPVEEKTPAQAGQDRSSGLLRRMWVFCRIPAFTRKGYAVVVRGLSPNNTRSAGMTGQ